MAERRKREYYPKTRILNTQRLISAWIHLSIVEWYIFESLQLGRISKSYFQFQINYLTTLVKDVTYLHHSTYKYNFQNSTKRDTTRGILQKNFASFARISGRTESIYKVETCNRYETKICEGD